MNGVPVAFRGVERVDGMEDRRVVHQAVQAPELRFDLPEQAPNLGNIRQIRPKGPTATGGRRGEGIGLGRVVVDRDLGAAACEVQRDAAPDPLRGAGHGNDLAFQCVHRAVRRVPAATGLREYYDSDRAQARPALAGRSGGLSEK